MKKNDEYNFLLVKRTFVTKKIKAQNLDSAIEKLLAKNILNDDVSLDYEVEVNGEYENLDRKEALKGYLN